MTNELNNLPASATTLTSSETKWHAPVLTFHDADDAASGTHSNADGGVSPNNAS